MPQLFWQTRGIPNAPIGFPGQASNPVGYANAPGYAGLTAWPGGGFTNGTPGAPTVYSFYDFDAGTGGTSIPTTASWIKFVGCRFQSNQVAFYNVQAYGSNITLSYCSVTPRAALNTAPPFAAWPSASAGLQKTGDGTGYQIGGNSGYQYGIMCDSAQGPITIDHCDIWGFGNAITFLGTTVQINVTDCWIHDGADAALQLYHTDGPGYLNGGAGPNNITIDHCTIASIGNTNALAFQAATGGYNTIKITRNFLSGFGYTADLGHNYASAANWAFTDNTFGTDLPWVNGPLYSNTSAIFVLAGVNNLWRRNKLRVLSGTSNLGISMAWTVANDQQFLLPNQTYSATDWAS